MNHSQITDNNQKQSHTQQTWWGDMMWCELDEARELDFKMQKKLVGFTEDKDVTFVIQLYNINVLQ